MLERARGHGKAPLPVRDRLEAISGKPEESGLSGCYGCGGGDAWIKTVRTYQGERVRICDECYEVAREVLKLVIVPGDVSVSARCDECWSYGNPRDFTGLRRNSVRADAYGGLCPECSARRCG